ncbi:hypothetical protein DFQ28_011274 [Apophysomyces sp. BC1034]|nr:hypothetical protein DFQ30_010917 [Apophysomyces sp. BC1015]KAG0181245.1 hypothetical protein DFQ29_008948 [Apophysomyces sp. BC1021]KAG0191674.1 hypothetical protein DFQ28_011274 [Apophysomyces sp. BC1034]
MKTLFILSLAPLVLSQTIKNLVVFGDSYSDVGNFQRWSNGPIWSENLAVGWNASLLSFAISGATCDNAPFVNLTESEPMPSVKDQIEHYYNLSLNHSMNETIFAFWVGAADIHNTFKLQGESSGVPDFKELSACIIQQMREVRQVFGANRFILLNTLPLQHLPYFAGTEMAENRANASIQLNKLLVREVNMMNKYYHALELDLVDMHTLISDIVADPEAFNFTDATTPFWDKCQGQCTEEKVNDYVWWDQTHLTGGVHEKIANSILSAASFADPTWVNSDDVQTLIQDPHSPYRSKNYTSPLNTGLIGRIIEELNAAKQLAKNTARLNHIQDDNNITTSISHSYLMFTLFGLIFFGIVLGIRKRRSTNAFNNVSGLFGPRRGTRFTPIRKTDDGAMA